MPTQASLPRLDDAKVGPDALARSVVRASAAPLLLLDGDFGVIAASAGYLDAFHDIQPEGKRLEEITGGAWAEAQVQELLHAVRHGGRAAAIDTAVTCPEGVRQVRVMIESVTAHGEGASQLVVSIQDRTDAIAREAAQEAQLQEASALLEEAQHRIANNLAIIASILSIKARLVASEETRIELESARLRMLAMAATERHLQYKDPQIVTAVGPYLEALCQQLRASLLGDGRDIRLAVKAGPGSLPRRTAALIGLVVIELVVNALKHAFPGASSGKILVAYHATQRGWRLCVSDNGSGVRSRPGESAGLGTSIVNALVAQLKARMRVSGAESGVRVDIRTGRTPGDRRRA